jgi:hypothetical protein
MALEAQARQQLDRTLHAASVEPIRPQVLAAADFLGRFQPIESIVDGLPVPRGGLVSVTGPTGGGKTTLCCAIEVALCTGASLAGREVTEGAVLVLAGENPDDYAMHLMATLQQTETPRTTLDGRLFVIPGTFDFLFELDWLHKRIAAIGRELVAIFVDTSAAFYSGEDENDNVAMRRHASALRELCALPGRPTVFVLCHPTKNAQRENLLPRGGGAFLAEVDANLTVWRDGAGIVTLHYAGKIRGPSFDPIRFELVPVELEDQVDCRGRPISSVAARHVPDERAEAIEAKVLDDENRLLVAMQRKPGASVADLAMAAGFTTGVGAPHKSKVSRLLAALKAQELVRKDRSGAWLLTAKGQKEADALP